ncbi:MAG: hypothetical protein HZB51_09570 [Chloroflexi bacterium]|nr:hypothetical protein [Chloroflexota bacterium]
MSSKPFRAAKEQFFRLKGQLSTGRITQQQFDAALKQLVIQDTQGCYWILHPDSGRWLVYDGKTWIDAKPTLGEADRIPTLPHPEVARMPSGLRTYHELRAIGKLTSSTSMRPATRV